MQDLDDRLPEAVVEDDRLDGHADVGVDRDDGGNLLQLAQGLPLEAWRSTSHVAWGLAEGGGRVNMCIRLCILCVFASGLDTQCILCIWTPQPVYCPSRVRFHRVQGAAHGRRHHRHVTIVSEMHSTVLQGTGPMAACSAPQVAITGGHIAL